MFLFSDRKLSKSLYLKAISNKYYLSYLFNTFTFEITIYFRYIKERINAIEKNLMKGKWLN